MDFILALTDLAPSSIPQGVANAVLLVYFLCLLGLTLYGTHRWYLIWLYARNRAKRTAPRAEFDALPMLTVQLPLFNERYVARRLIDAVCELDYPRDRLEIQVLDDSTDDTVEIVGEIVAEQQKRGLNIVHLHRTHREGFKAGALEAGLQVAQGELLAVFDADFLPDRDFAKRLIHHFTDPKVGMVQARWGHLNPEHSPLTQVQSLLLDGHFVIEHTARHRSGRFFNFNGTAGIWRKSCIADAGGWQHDTLTEDLDLSYRAQMKGWKFIYAPEHVAPAELPVEMSAFKSQQHRWAKGSIQTARKLLPAITRSSLSLPVKLEAVVHLTANVGYVLMVALALLVVPSIWMRSEISPWMLLAIDLPLFSLSTLSVAGFYLVARYEAVGTTKGLLRWVPFLMAVGIGLSINNARAVIEAMLGQQSEFRRTPKYNLEKGQSLKRRRYRGSVSWDTLVEATLAVYFFFALIFAIRDGLWAAVPFLMLFEVGYGYTAGLSLFQAAQKSASPALQDDALEQA